MPEGVIVGGWGYVIGAYAVFALVILGYAAVALRRFSLARRHDPAARGPASSPPRRLAE